MMVLAPAWIAVSLAMIAAWFWQRRAGNAGGEVSRRDGIDEALVPLHVGGEKVVIGEEGRAILAYGQKQGCRHGIRLQRGAIGGDAFVHAPSGLSTQSAAEEKEPVSSSELMTTS